MKIPRKLALLGFVRAIEYLRTGYRRNEVAQFEKSSLALCSSSTGSRLFLIPFDVTKTGDRVAGSYDGESKIFESWSDFEAEDLYAVQVSDVEPKRFGELIEITYESDKWSGTGQRYYHRYDNPPRLYKAGRGKRATWAITTGNKKLVTDQGLIG